MRRLLVLGFLGLAPACSKTYETCKAEAVEAKTEEAIELALQVCDETFPEPWMGDWWLPLSDASCLWLDIDRDGRISVGNRGRWERIAPKCVWPSLEFAPLRLRCQPEIDDPGSKHSVVVWPGTRIEFKGFATVYATNGKCLDSFPPELIEEARKARERHAKQVEEAWEQRRMERELERERLAEEARKDADKKFEAGVKECCKCLRTRRRNTSDVVQTFRWNSV